MRSSSAIVIVSTFVTACVLPEASRGSLGPGGADEGGGGRGDGGTTTVSDGGGTGGKGGEGGEGGEGGAGACGGEPCVLELALGHEFSCALIDDGTVRCWGTNEKGQLGVDPEDLERSNTPVEVEGIQDARSIAAGSDHVCVTRSEEVVCWGANDRGQIGLGTVSAHEPPTTLDTPPMKRVGRAREATQCAVSMEQEIYCWGHNTSAQVGGGETSAAPELPTKVEGLGLASAAIACTSHACALSTTGEVWCWGDDELGQLGDGTEGGVRPSPAAIPEMVAHQIGCGTEHTCAVVDDHIECWGANDNCQLGTGTFDAAVPDPVSVPGAVVGSHVSGGEETSCAIIDARPHCWGRALDGAVGNGSVLDGTVCEPYEVAGFEADAAFVESGWWHSCAVLLDGRVRCWGRNDDGQLGDGTFASSGSAVSVAW